MSDAFDRNTNFGSWDKLGSRYYRKFEVYQMSWGTDVDLSTSIAVAAPFGGPLGLSQETISRGLKEHAHRTVSSPICVHLDTKQQSLVIHPSLWQSQVPQTNPSCFFTRSLESFLDALLFA